jgi:uncharacterized protein
MADAATLSIWVQPNASRARIIGRHGDAIKIAVAAPPEKGKANKAVESLLAKALALPPRDVKVISGTSSRAKTVRISGMAQVEVDEVMDALI